MLLLQLAEKLDAVHFGHPEVAHDDVRRALADESERLHSALGAFDAVPVVFEESYECVSTARFVIDDEHADRRFRGEAAGG